MKDIFEQKNEMYESIKHAWIKKNIYLLWSLRLMVCLVDIEVKLSMGTVSWSDVLILNQSQFHQKRRRIMYRNSPDSFTIMLVSEDL